MDACYKLLPTALQSERFENMNSFMPLLASILSDLEERGDLRGSGERGAAHSVIRGAQTSWDVLERIQKSTKRQDRRRKFTKAAEHALREIEEEITTTAAIPALLADPPRRQPVVTNKLIATQLRRCAHCGRLMVSAMVESHLKYCKKAAAAAADSGSS